MPAVGSRHGRIWKQGKRLCRVAVLASAVSICWLSALLSPRWASAEERQSLITPRDEKVLEILAREFDWKMDQMPIGEVAETIGKWCNINVWIDERALKEVGIASDVALTFRGRSVPVEVALERMLEPLELSWTVMDGLLVLTTPEVVEAYLSTRIYNVRDLLAKGYDFYGNSHYDFDSLIELIESTVQPNTWDTVGGPGSIKEYCNDFDVALVVSQTSDVHGEIDELFRMLRLLPSSNHRQGQSSRTNGSTSPVRRRTALAPAWPPVSDAP